MKSVLFLARSRWTRSVLVVASSLLVAATHAGNPVVVYDNSTGGGAGLIWGQVPGGVAAGQEGGDEVTLDPLTTQRHVVKLELWYSVFGTTNGTADMRFRIYANDGPPEPTTGFPTPGTILWDSGVLEDYPHQAGLNVFMLDIPNVLVPNTITWTVLITDRRGSTGSMGPEIYNPPTVGTSRPTYWRNPGTGWIDQPFVPYGNFGSRVTADSAAEVTVRPSSFTLFRGVLVSGDVASLGDADDNRLEARPGVVLNQAERPVQIIIEGTAPGATASSMKVVVEAHCNIPNINQRIEAFNYTANDYTTLDSRNSATADERIELTVPNPGEYVGPSNALKARISYKEAGPVFSYPWFARVDEATWRVTP